jgi:hypothetical protein
MAEVKKQSGKTRKRGTAKSDAVEKRRRKPAAKKQAESSITVDPNVDGEEALRNSVNREVAANATKIAKALAKRAEKGNAACDKFLLDLMRRKKEPVKPRSKSMSTFINMLESEPEWVKPKTGDVKQS